ncbi:hypothetical protein F5Y06DRAFT_264483 [Hypoxylon sp. FL0890]|nr:hypothetical protein F5Y06DRAFT_264483 [Hypoxylon sp. FL0890]
MSTPREKLIVVAYQIILATIGIHFLYCNVGLFDEYILQGFFHRLFSGSLHFKFPSFRFHDLSLPTFSWPTVEVPRTGFPTADFSSSIETPLSSLTTWIVFVGKWASSSLIPWVWFPPVFAVITQIVYLTVLGFGENYTMTYHGEHSRISFELILETFVTPLFIFTLIYNLVDWFTTPGLLFVESPLIEWFIRSVVALAHVSLIIRTFVLAAFLRICKVYTSFDLLEARLRMSHDTWRISETWRHTKLSRFLQRFALWTFDIIGPLVPFYGPDHPRRLDVERELRLLQFHLRAKLMAALGVDARESTAAVRRFRTERWYLP